MDQVGSITNYKTILTGNKFTIKIVINRNVPAYLLRY